MSLRPNWFAIVYIAGVVLVAHVADELHDSGWLLVLAAFWAVALPFVYALGLFQGRRMSPAEQEQP